MTKGIAEVASFFRVPAAGGANSAGEVYPAMQASWWPTRSAPMTWSFILAMTSKKNGALLKPKPVNNARGQARHRLLAGQLHQARCLIPVTAWAAAEGKKVG